MTPQVVTIVHNVDLELVRAEMTFAESRRVKGHDVNNKCDITIFFPLRENASLRALETEAVRRARELMRGLAE